MNTLAYTDLRRRVAILWEHDQHGINPRYMVDVNRPTELQVQGDKEAKPPIPPAKWEPKWEFNDPRLEDTVAIHLAGLTAKAARETLHNIALDLPADDSIIPWGMKLRMKAKRKEYGHAA